MAQTSKKGEPASTQVLVASPKTRPTIASTVEPVRGSRLLLVTLILFLLIGGGTWFVLEDEDLRRSFLTYKDSVLSLMLGEQELATVALGPAKKMASGKKDNPDTTGANSSSEPLPSIAVTKPIDQSSTPYEFLGNPLKVEPLQGYWQLDDERRWREAIQHKYFWQHYKTVEEVKKARLNGSTSILREALRDKKFWTRMRAAIALADFGVPPSPEELKEVLKGERSELVANFFQRFHKQSSPGEAYIMRMALSLADERGRKSILEVLKQLGGKTNLAYIRAARQDPSPGIRKWAITR